MKGKKRAYNTAKYSDLAVIALIKFLLIHANQVTNWLITYPISYYKWEIIRYNRCCNPPSHINMRPTMKNYSWGPPSYERKESNSQYTEIIRCTKICTSPSHINIQSTMKIIHLYLREKSTTPGIPSNSSLQTYIQLAPPPPITDKIHGLQQIYFLKLQSPHSRFLNTL